VAGWSREAIDAISAIGRYNQGRETATGTDGRKAFHVSAPFLPPPPGAAGNMVQPHMTLGPNLHLVAIRLRGEEVSLMPGKGDPDITRPRVVMEDTRTPIRQLPPLAAPRYRTWALYDDEVVKRAKEASSGRRR
jgi:hypothetical protein